MPDQDYVTRTLNAYNHDPQKFEDATKDMTPYPEMEDFIQGLPTSSLPVVDAGCAYGRDSIELSKRINNSVVGIDMSVRLLARAKKLYPGLDFQEMDVRHLTFADHSIAGIWSHATLLHLNDADVEKALLEFARVLMPNGALFASFKEGQGEEEIVDKFSSDGVRFYRYQSQVSVKRLLTAAGFKIIKLYSINERERWGDKYRDLNWVYILAMKP